jgi:hypothetical protein
VKGFSNRWSPLLLVILFLILHSDVFAATETLESAALRIEVITSPYSYRVIDRASGKVLLTQSSTGITFGPELYRVGRDKHKQDATKPAG